MKGGVSKSWWITIIPLICALILPVANDHLAGFGIHVTETEITTFLVAFLGAGAVGAGSAAHKRHIANKVEAKVAEMNMMADSADGRKPERYVPAGSHIKLSQKHNPYEVPREGSTAAPEQKSTDDVHITERDTGLGPVGSKFQTNFIYDKERGNSLRHGSTTLMVKVVGARSYVSALVKDSNEKVIAVGQSTKTDDDNDVTTVTLNLKDRSGNPIPTGQYTLITSADSGTSYAIGHTDVFQVI